MTAKPSPLEPCGGIRFNPFDGQYVFDGTRCLISGQPIDPATELRPLFPDRWVEELGLAKRRCQKYLTSDGTGGLSGVHGLVRATWV